MARFDALAVAIALHDRPQTAKLARACRLPDGVTFLLEIAAGESDALHSASELTGRTATNLQRVAGFFIEQVLMHPTGDSYRILGSEKEAPLGILRRNMALLMRWLHPDVTSNGTPSAFLNRSVFASRITQAWETIKTEARREAYDNALAKGSPPLESRVNLQIRSKIVYPLYQKTNRSPNDKAQRIVPLNKLSERLLRLFKVWQ